MIKKLICGLALSLGFASLSFAQDPTASQKFRVIVPTSISITAPNEIEMTHDQSDNDLSFPNQAWVVKANVLSGVTVGFAVQSPFVHTTDATFKRDARLSLAVNSSLGPATWTVTTASDQTDYANADDSASVVAESNGVGRATFDLAVQFITNDFGTFAAGNYETTVVGTVTAN